MQRLCPLLFQGVNPQTPKSVIVSRYPLSSLLGQRGELTHNPPAVSFSHAQGGEWWVATAA